MGQATPWVQSINDGPNALRAGSVIQAPVNWSCCFGISSNEGPDEAGSGIEAPVNWSCCLGISARSCDSTAAQVATTITGKTNPRIPGLLSCDGRGWPVWGAFTPIHRRGQISRWNLTSTLIKQSLISDLPSRPRLRAIAAIVSASSVTPHDAKRCGLELFYQSDYEGIKRILKEAN